MDIGKRIKELRKERSLTQKQFGQLVHKSSQVISNWERGYTTGITAEDLQSIAHAFGIPEGEILNSSTTSSVAFPFDLSANDAERHGVLIPVLGVVRAGIPIYAEENILGYEEIPRAWASQGEYYCLIIKGNSMEPTFHEGDTVIVRKQPDVDSGDIAIVLINGDEATVKEISKSPSGITLIGHNASAFKPVFFSNHDIETIPVQIIGRVMELRRKY